MIYRTLIVIEYSIAEKIIPYLVARRLALQPHQRSWYHENRNDFKRLIEIDSVIYCVYKPSRHRDVVVAGTCWAVPRVENRLRIETPRYRLFVLLPLSPSYASSLFPWFSHFPAVRSPLVAELAVALLFFQLLRHPLTSPSPLSLFHPIIPYPPF